MLTITKEEMEVTAGAALRAVEKLMKEAGIQATTCYMAIEGTPAVGINITPKADSKNVDHQVFIKEVEKLLLAQPAGAPARSR